MSLRLIDSERQPDGSLRRVYYDSVERTITHRYTQDVEPILESNKAEFNDSGKRSGFHRVASIPSVVIERVIQDEGITFRELMDAKSDHARRVWNRLLNDREFRYFRTRPGRVDVKQR